jgi:hypothetical protein
MKRDMDLIRKIILDIEEQPLEKYGMGAASINEIEGYSKAEIMYHIRLLIEAGFVSAIDVSSHGDGLAYTRPRLTWQGYEFLEAIRNDARWNKVKGMMEKAGAFVVVVAQQVAIDLIKQSLQPHTR